MAEITKERLEQELLLEALVELENRKKTEKMSFSYPETGPRRRELYPKHLEFFTATATHSECIFLASNRSGKTFSGAHAIAYHVTGEYPEWWPGRRFSKPVSVWVAGKTGQSTRDIIQKELLGERTEIGSGTIPKRSIVDFKSRPGIPDGIETVTVKHVSGGSSVITFKTYDSGTSSFVGVALDVVWLDELPDNPAIYLECMVRLMTKKGLCMVTATPDKGMSPTILAFFPDGKIIWGTLPGGHKHVTNMTWDETPHLDESEKERLLSGMSPHEKMAKTMGLPYLGAGQIWPIPEQEYMIKPFEIPRNWEKCCGLDVGWAVTSAVYIAIDYRKIKAPKKILHPCKENVTLAPSRSFSASMASSCGAL